MASPLASEQLLARLRDEDENPMVTRLSKPTLISQLQVRHECAEALGDIPGVEIEAEMAKYLDPKVDPVVRESCVVGIALLCLPFSCHLTINTTDVTSCNVH